MAENYTACMLNLVIEKFAEILLIHSAFFRVNNGCKAVKLYVVAVNFAYCGDNIAEFSYA